MLTRRTKTLSSSQGGSRYAMMIAKRRGGITRLDQLASGQAGLVRGLMGGHTFVGRLSALGFTPGAEVRMVQNYGRGPIIVMIRGTRIALGRGQARRVMVVLKGR